MHLFKRSWQAVLLLAILSIPFLSTAQKNIIDPAKMPEKWSRQYKPFRIAGNLYYVGTYDLACYLITTPRGHILINTGLSGSLPMIESNVRELGFRLSDVKILLTNQVHFDHVGAMAEAKFVTKAKMMVHKDDAQVLEDGGNSDFLYGGKGYLFAPVQADRLLRNRDLITLGDMMIAVLHHPGHTKGSVSYLFAVKDEKRWYRVLIANMPTVLDEMKLPGMAAYPEIGKDFSATFNSMRRQQFDIWLAAHGSQFGLHDKHKPGDAYNPEAFVDRQGYNERLDKLEQDYQDKLKK